MAASFFTVNASAAEALSIEQVKLAPPDMDVYVHADDADLSVVKPADVKAQLGSHTFDVKSIESQERLSEGKKTDTVTSDASSDGEAPVQETITDKNIEKKQAVIFIAIIAVIIVAAAVVVILLMIHRKKAREAFFKENGLDPHEIEEIDKKIRQKRRRH